MKPVVLMLSFCLFLALDQLIVSSAPRPRPADWLDQLFSAGSTGGRNYYGDRPAAPAPRQPRDRFRSICRVISGGDNYAHPGRVPYPSAPFCPYGD